MKKLLYLFLVLGLFACSSDSADDDSNNSNPCPNQPQLITYEVSNINIDESTDLAGATFTAEIQNIQLGPNCETFSITNQGFVYGTNIQPTTSDNIVNANGQNASVTLNDLAPETTYYVRAYLTNTLGTFYGNEVNFTTPQSTNPVYLAENGVTVKARDWAVVGDSGIINGITYTIVDGATLTSMIQNGDDITRVCTTRIVDMNSLFWSYGNDIPNISSWDVSNVVNMSQMLGWSNLYQDISYWDVSNVTNMSQMFYQSTFNGDISDWDVSNVTNMSSMFSCSDFNQPIGTWDVSNVTYMGNMFWANCNPPTASNFNQDISNWDVSNVTSMMSMFTGNEEFNQDISNWDVSNVECIGQMFYEATSFNQDLSSWNVENVSTQQAACSPVCASFCYGATSWTLPKPDFTNCDEYTYCD